MQSVLSRGDLILRKDVEEFEQNFSKFVGARYAVGVASGTDALILSLKVLGIGNGDKVLTPSYTFRAAVEAIHHVGATPVLYDMDGKIDFTSDIKAFVPAYLEGEVPPGIGGVIDSCKLNGMKVVEDACQAIGAAPVRGDTACYSFYPAKILGCYGDGGAIATDNEGIYEELKMMRNHYKGDWSKYGYNSRLDNLQAAVLNVKLKYLPEVLGRRKAIADRYSDELKGVGLPTRREVYQDYVVSHEKRNILRAYLASKGIETMANEYPFPSGLQKGRLAQEYEKHSVRIPCNETLTDEEVGYVIEMINAFK